MTDHKKPVPADNVGGIAGETYFHQAASAPLVTPVRVAPERVAPVQVTRETLGASPAVNESLSVPENTITENSAPENTPLENKEGEMAKKSQTAKPHHKKFRRPPPPRFAALDLGTNNCRLLIVAPRAKSFRVIDAFSRIVRLGEGVSRSGSLSEAAMDRTLDALKICSEKIAYRRVSRVRAIATQACRMATNGAEFLHRIKTQTGLTLETISTKEEAALSVRGCHELIDNDVNAVLVFDIGGGSTEISWVLPAKKRRRPWAGARRDMGLPKFVSWMSLPFGVVTLAERYPGPLSRAQYDQIVDEIADQLRAFREADSLKPHFTNGQAHLLGTSGTVTSLAGLHLQLKQYNRRAVDGLWLETERALAISEELRAMSLEQRSQLACIGAERADLVVPGCAIMEAIVKVWPSLRIRVADRGLREGLLAELMEQHRRERSAKKRAT